MNLLDDTEKMKEKLEGYVYERQRLVYHLNGTKSGSKKRGLRNRLKFLNKEIARLRVRILGKS